MKQGILRAFFAITTALLLCLSVQAQTAAYTVHTIASGETLSALAKTYHTTVGDIMRLNDMHADSKLQIGDKIKIPATGQPVQRTAATPKTEPATTATNPPTTTTNSPATATANNKEALTHTVKSGESLYRISKTYNIPVDRVIAINHLKNAGEIKVGQVLIVSDGTPPPPTAPTKVRAETTPAATTTAVTTTTAAVPAPPPVNEVPPPATQSKKVTDTDTAPADNTTSLPPAPVQTQSNTTVAPVTTTATNTTSALAQPAFASTAAAPGSDFFTQQFGHNVEGRSEQTKAGTAMTFKSASGWGDKKFYILMNDAPPGSIVKVSNGNNAVYAKVLWSLGTQKENNGLDFRISTATAAALNITDEKFDVTVTYYQ